MVLEIEQCDGWLRHAGGWNLLNHPDVPELVFLSPDAAPNVSVSYEEQRASMAAQEQEMLEKAIEESRKAAPTEMKMEGVFAPCDGLVGVLHVIVTVCY